MSLTRFHATSQSRQRKILSPRAICRPRIRAIIALFAMIPLWAGIALARAEDVAVAYPQVREFFPQADRFGGLEGEPRAAPAFRGERLLGYAFLTNDVMRIPAYSGKPINNLVGFDVSGRITGLAVVHHEEPILAVGITPERLKQFTDQYRGKSVFDRIAVGAEREGYVQVDAISGATITTMVENATIMRSVRQVAESRGLTLSAAAEASEIVPSTTRLTALAPAPAAGGAVIPAPRGTRSLPPPAATGPSPAGKVAAVPRAAVEREMPPPEPHATRLAPPSEEAIWIFAWRKRVFEIGVLVAGLIGLTLILIFQDWLARRPKLVAWVRNAFLLFTLFFIGWYALAQLTVINVLTFVHAAMREFNWEHFLIDPMLFILWSFVAITLLLWGRGVYCGWLCPFGALQELINKIAQRVNVPQWEFPDVVHERLWAVKYVILIMLFGISLQSMGEAAVYAEVEPFKTTFSMHFHREWPFVLYAGALIAVTVFNRKFFCKYLCPLGAALAIPGRFRLFDWWLRRRKECGKPCQTCSHDCPVRAIRPTGEINANECHYCLDCQVTYYNERKCPPLIERLKRRERLPRAREAVRELEAAIGPYGGPGSGGASSPKNQAKEPD